MNQALHIYILFQNLLFSVAFLVGRKPKNKPLILYFTYFFFFYLLLILSSKVFPVNYADNEFVLEAYYFIAFGRTAVIVYFIYSVMEQPMPRALYWLWALPLLGTLYYYIYEHIDSDLFNSGFYNNWYLSFPMYIKMLFVLLLIWLARILKKEIAENSSSKDHYQILKLYWISYFIRFQLLLHSLSLLYLFFTLANGRLYSLDFFLSVYSPAVYDMIYNTFTAFFLFVFGYLALRNPSVFNDPPAADPSFEQNMVEIVLPEEEKSFQKKIEFTGEQVSQYTLRLSKLMEEDKVYLDAELTLSKLARLSGIPARQLSQFIKHTFHKNYKDYINGHRVVYAKKLLTQKSNTDDTMFAITLDSGFNSVSSFYKIFKEQTGMAPKQYQEKFKEQGLN